MAVVIDVIGTEILGAIASASPQTYTGLTTGGSLSNGCVTFVVMYDNLAVTGTAATWDGVACTLIASQNSTGGTFGRVELWGLSPIGTHTGNKTFSITFSGGTAQLVIQGQSWTGANQSGGTATFNNSVAATANTNTATGNVTSQTGDAVFAGYVCANQTMSGQTGTLLFNDNAPNSYIASASETVGAASVTMSATLAGISIWAMAGANILQASSAPTGGGTPTDGGTRFKRTFFYQSIAQPVVFVTATTPYAGWDDTLEWPRPAQPRSTIYSAPFIAQILGVFQDRDSPDGEWANWPDFASGKPRLPLHQPWSFVPPPAQVFFPYAPWDDFARRKPQPLDTQPLAWPPTPVATPFPAMGWINWPDFAPRAKQAADFISWTFIPPAAQVWFPYGPWDDFTRRRPQYPDTQPLAWTGQNIAAPAPTMAWVRWPDFASKKPSAADLWPLAFVPLVPTATTIGDWPDFVRRKPQPLDTQPLSWTGQTIFAPAPVMPWTNWPDFAPKKPAPLIYDPFTLVQLAPQIWYPAAPWPDYVVRKKQPLDTQPTAFVQIVTPQATFIVTSNWPDFAQGRRRPLNFDALALGQPPVAPNTGYSQWPDFVWAKKRPLNYDPLTLVQTVRTPWNNMAQWPDFAPIRGKKGLHAALQQFSAKYPGIVSQSAVTGIMAAFEKNSDTAQFAIYVIDGGGPAVRALVSILELPIIGSATSVEEI